MTRNFPVANMRAKQQAAFVQGHHFTQVFFTIEIKAELVDAIPDIDHDPVDEALAEQVIISVYFRPSELSRP